MPRSEFRLAAGPAVAPAVRSRASIGTTVAIMQPSTFRLTLSAVHRRERVCGFGHGFSFSSGEVTRGAGTIRADTLDGMSAEAWVAATAVVVSVIALLVAAGQTSKANGIADDARREAERANVLAKAALDIQKRIDDRAAEYRDVRWEGSWETGPDIDHQMGFALKNVGTTRAARVTLIIEVRYSEEVFTFDSIEPGEGRIVVVKGQTVDEFRESQEMELRPPFRVHWTSPLGHAQEESFERSSLFG